MYLPGISISNPGFIVFGEASSKKKSEVDDNGDGIGNFYAKINSNANRNGESNGNHNGNGWNVYELLLLTVTIIIPSIMSMGIIISHGIGIAYALFYSQTRSSVPPKNPLMNLLFKS